MGLFKRALVHGDGSLPYKARAGEGIMDNITVATLADANATLTVAQLSGGALQGNFTAGRTLTTPTAALILAACTDMDIGDSFTVLVSMQGAQTATFAAGAGVSLAGRTVVAASGICYVVITKLSNTTVQWRGL